MPTVDILFRTKFEDAGSKAALQSLEQLLVQVKSMAALDAPTSLLDFPPQGGAATIQAYQTALADLAQAFVEAGRAAAMAGDAEKANKYAEQAKQVLSMSKSLDVLTKNYGTLAQIESVQAKAEKELITLKQRLVKETTALDKATEAYIKRQNEMRKNDLATMLKSVQKETRRAAEEYRNATAAGRQMAMSDKELILANLEFTGGAQGLVKALQAQEQQFRRAADAALDMGDALRAARLQETANTYGSLVQQFQQTPNSSLWQTFKSGASAVLNPLNKVGFGLFLITQNLKTVQMIVGGAFNALLDGAKKADIAINSRLNLEAAGIDAFQFSKNIDAASRGLVTLSSAQLAVNTAMRDGNRELAEAVPLLVEIATSAAISRGDVTLAQQYFDALFNGISKVQPDMLEQVGIFGSAEEATFLYQLKLNNLGDELVTTSEKQQALLNLVKEQGGPIIDAAKDIDTYAEAWVRLKNETGEATDEFKIVLGIVGSEALTSFSDVFQGIADDIGLSVEGMSLFTQALYGAGIIGLSVIESLRDEIKEIGLDFATLGRAAKLFFEGEFAAASDEFAKRFETLDILDFLLQKQSPFSVGRRLMGAIIEGFVDSFDASKDSPELRQAIIELERALGIELLSGDIDNTGLGKLPDQIAELKRQFEEAEDPPARLTQILEQLNSALDGQFSLTVDIAKAWRNYQDTLDDIDADLEDRLDDLKDNHGQRLADLEQDYFDRLDDINSDINDDIIDAQEEADKKREKAQEKGNDKREKLERDHQRRINEIMRRYELSRLTALIDRDARALFEAEMRKNEELQSEEEKYKDSLAELEKAKKEELKAIEEAEADKIKKIQEKADEARADALKNYERQQRDAEKNYERQRRDARAAAGKRRRDALDSYRDQKQDLTDSYNERQMLQKLRESAMTLEQARELGIRGDELDFYLDEAERRWEDYFDFLELLFSGFDFGNGVFRPPSGGTPGRGTTPPPGSTTPPPAGSPGLPNCDRTQPNQPHGYCLAGNEGQTYICPNTGISWTCCSGKWYPTNFAPCRTTNNAPVSTQSSTTTTTGGAAIPTTTSPLSGGSQRVTLVVQGDSALKELIESVTTDVIVEVIST